MTTRIQIVDRRYAESLKYLGGSSESAINKYRMPIIEKLDDKIRLVMWLFGDWLVSQRLFQFIRFDRMKKDYLRNLEAAR